MKKRLVQLLVITTMIIATGCGRQANNENAELWTHIQSENNGDESAEAEVKTESDEKEVSVEVYGEAEQGEKSELEERGGQLEAEVQSKDSAEINEEENEEESYGASSTVEDSVTTNITENVSSSDESLQTSSGLLTSTADINLTDVDGNGASYTFTYDGEQYSAEYITDNWKIRNSYKINNESDMIIICQALIDEKPVHGRDMESYRTAEDMVYEWVIHNMAYELLSDDDAMKAHAKDVDFDPKDQNRSFDEIYEDRTGKEFNINDFLNRMN